MGLALATRLLAAQEEVIIAGRSGDRLKAAARQLGNPQRLRTIVSDVTREEEVLSLFESSGTLGHIVSTAADVSGVYALLPSIDTATARRVLDSKIMGPWLLAKHGAPKLAIGGSITFTSGIAAYRPASRGSVVAAVNGALESLVYALAVELAPIRVNVVSPGWTETPIWEAVAGEGKTEMLSGMAKRLPVGRVGRPEDIADAIWAVMRNSFVNGTVFHVDGGQRLV